MYQIFCGDFHYDVVKDANGVAVISTSLQEFGKLVVKLACSGLNADHIWPVRTWKR